MGEFRTLQLSYESHDPSPTTPPNKFDGLGCSTFARRYSQNHFCFLFLQVLRYFNSLRSLRAAMYSQHSTPYGVGRPIQTPPDQSLLGNSPRLFAAFHVFHRLLVPRHPLIALSHLLFVLNLSYELLNLFVLLKSPAEPAAVR